MNHEMDQRIHEREVRILAAEHADDVLIRTALALDLAIRRAAWRALALMRADAASRSLQH